MSNLQRPQSLGIIATTIASLVIGFSQNAVAQRIDFDDLNSGTSLFGFDVNEDGVSDVRFSSLDASSFNVAGPPPAGQAFANGQVMEHSSSATPDIRVDFLGGATGTVQLGFVLLTQEDDVGQGMSLEVFDDSGMSLASTSERGELLALSSTLMESAFPEGFLSVAFDGVASYALLDATTTGGRFVIDGFSGVFAPAAVPEPAVCVGWLLGLPILLRRRLAA